MKQRTVVAASLLAALIIIPTAFSCKTAAPRQGLDHPNLRRFDNHQINQIIITAWDNFDKGNYEASALDFERLINKSYIDDDILFGAAIAYYNSSTPRKALAYSTGALEKNPGHFEALILRSTVYLNLGKPEAARKDLEKLVAMKFEKDLVCGYYFDENDIAGRSKFEARKTQARKELGLE